MVLTALSAIVALLAVGETGWVVHQYVRRMSTLIRAGERRSGLLPAHVASVASWALIMLLRAIVRDQYEDHAPPLWLGKPFTLIMAVWLAAALLLLVRHYGGRGRRLRERPDRRSVPRGSGPS